MSRYASYGQLDTRFQEDGDVGFKGIDLKHDRPLLEPGMVAKSINKRLRTGVAMTRPGTRVPSNFNPAFTNTLVGSVIYSNPNGVEHFLIAENGRSFVWDCVDGSSPAQIPITGGGAAIGAVSVWFVQAFDKVLLLRAGLTPLIWDGVNYVTGFVPITKLDPLDTSTNLIPNVGYGINFQNRILYVNIDAADKSAKQTILMSDALDYTSYDPVLAKFRINAGEADEITCIHPYGKDSILVFMRHSIHRFSNFTVDPALAVQELVNDEIGCINREAAVQVAGDIIFLSRAGFYRASQVFENQTIAASVPISDLINPLLLGELNWPQIEQSGMASLAFLGDYLYASVPMRAVGSTWPGTILVYNTVTSQWESFDGWVDSNFAANQLRVTLVGGERRLFGLNHVQSCNYLLYEGITDQTKGVMNSVNDILETRGYGLQQLGLNTWKRFVRLSMAMRTTVPLIQVFTLVDGYNEVKQIASPIAKGVSKYYTFWTPPYTDYPAIGPRYHDPYREDYYSGTEADMVATDMENIIPGQLDLLPGVEPHMPGGPRQESLERMSIRTAGRWVSIRVINYQGRCDIVGITVDMEERAHNVLTLA
jgi:hypothetical protein